MVFCILQHISIIVCLSGKFREKRHPQLNIQLGISDGTKCNEYGLVSIVCLWNLIYLSISLLLLIPLVLNNWENFISVLLLLTFWVYFFFYIGVLASYLLGSKLNRKRNSIFIKIPITLFNVNEMQDIYLHWGQPEKEKPSKNIRNE